MKALTLTQPWATLIAIGAKRIETRSWSTSYRGLLAIHAGVGLGPVGGRKGLAELICTAPFWETLTASGYCGANPRQPERGAIVAVARLVDVQQITASGLVAHGTTRPLPGEPERSFGDYTPGRFAWLLVEVRRLTAPVPCKGALGLWRVPAETMKAIEVQL